MKTIIATTFILSALVISLTACSEKPALDKTSQTMDDTSIQSSDSTQQFVVQVKKSFNESCSQSAHQSAPQIDMKRINQYCTCTYDKTFGVMDAKKLMEVSIQITAERKISDELKPLFDQAVQQCAAQLSK